MSIAVSVNEITKKYKLYKDKWGPLKEIITRKKLHDEFLALKDISLDFPKGEAIGVLGKNGSGKSTLLKIITGIAEASSGTVDIDGSLVFLDVSSGIDAELSGYENIFMKGVLLGYSKEEMLEKVDDIIEFSELGEFIYQPVKNYSSGMKAKLGFAISVNVDPDILIVDEALAVGDSRFREKCMNKMNNFKEQGKTIIFVSHDKHAVASFCSKAAWINQGELITFGESKYVSALYDDFMSGRKDLKAIRAEIKFTHSIEKVTHRLTEQGFSMELEGYLYDSNDNQEENSDKSFEFVLRDKRTGEELTKTLKRKKMDSNQLRDDNIKSAGFIVSISEKEYPSFFKPGKFLSMIRLKNYKNEKEEWTEFPLWAGNAQIKDEEAGENSGKFSYKFSIDGNNLILGIENHDTVQQQVNKMWFENNFLHIQGVAFVRGFETDTQDSVEVDLKLINLETFEEKTYPAIINKTDEITENPSFNPQGKNYNYSAFHTEINLADISCGKYECKLSFKMNKPPYQEFLILVWASNHKNYPEAPYLIDNRKVKIKTESKYLLMEVEKTRM